MVQLLQNIQLLLHPQQIQMVHRLFLVYLDSALHIRLLVEALSNLSVRRLRDHLPKRIQFLKGQEAQVFGTALGLLKGAVSTSVLCGGDVLKWFML